MEMHRKDTVLGHSGSIMYAKNEQLYSFEAQDLIMELVWILFGAWVESL